MGTIGTPATKAPGMRWYLGLIAACVLLAASLAACNGSGAATDEKALALEAKIHSLEESLEALQEENATLESELAALRQEQARFIQEQEAAGNAEGIEQREAAGGLPAAQEDRLDGLEESEAGTGERLDGLDSRLRELEAVASRVDLVLPAIESWFKGMDDRVKLLEGADLERTVNLAEAAGGEVYYLDHPDREELAVLVMPPEPIEGNPLIVSLHGFGGNSADHSIYVPLHQRLIRDGFGLLLPNGLRNADGQRFWNPTGQCCEGGKSGEDDAAYLSRLVADAQALNNFGPVYFFGYSNGGFMSYWMACVGLPGLRAVASLAGTSYVDDGNCEGAPPVSVLHIHGSEDEVVRFDGIQGEPDAEGKEGPGYAGALDMVRRWGERAGCDWPEDPQPYTALDLDGYVPGPETGAYRLESGCAAGISIEWWVGEGSSHGPGYGDAFVDALLEWLLAQE